MWGRGSRAQSGLLDRPERTSTESVILIGMLKMSDPMVGVGRS